MLSNQTKIGKYLVVTDQSLYYPNFKTKVFRVDSVGLNFLGIIKWYSPWRQYCFYPNPECIFNSGCLKDIETFLTEQNKLQREK